MKQFFRRGRHVFIVANVGYDTHIGSFQKVGTEWVFYPLDNEWFKDGTTMDEKNLVWDLSNDL